jgi:hypothetical protein
MIARIIVALCLLLPSFAFCQPLPPLRNLQVNGAAPNPRWPTFNLVGSGVSVSSDGANKRTNITFVGSGGGSGGIATSFQVLGAAPGSPASGDVWYDVSLGSFRMIHPPLWHFCFIFAELACAVGAIAP